jgi:hypothetical protein
MSQNIYKLHLSPSIIGQNSKKYNDFSVIYRNYRCIYFCKLRLLLQIAFTTSILRLLFQLTIPETPAFQPTSDNNHTRFQAFQKNPRRVLAVEQRSNLHHFPSMRFI